MTLRWAVTTALGRGRPPHEHYPAVSMLAWEAADDKSAKRVRCGECRGCQGEDCGQCANCADKPKFGGAGTCPRGDCNSARARPRSTRRATRADAPRVPCAVTSAGIKKQACFARKCIHVKPATDSPGAPNGARKRWKQNSGLPAMFADATGFGDFDEVHVTPPQPRHGLVPLRCRGRLPPPSEPTPWLHDCPSPTAQITAPRPLATAPPARRRVPRTASESAPRRPSHRRPRRPPSPPSPLIPKPPRADLGDPSPLPSPERRVRVPSYVLRLR
jgi:hypothetical protein